MRGARFWPIATIAFGLATLALLLGFSFLPAVRAAYPHGDFSQAMGAFQRVATLSDLQLVFGAPADPARVAAMQAANTLDLFAFIPVYGCFLLAGAAMLAGGVRKKLAWLALAPLFVGLIGDVLETTAQLRVTEDMARAAGELPIAPYAWIKWFGLALSAAGASAICFLGEAKRPLLGVLGLAPLVVTLAAWFGLIRASSLLTLGFALFWLPLLVIAVRAVFSPSQARDASP